MENNPVNFADPSGHKKITSLVGGSPSGFGYPENDPTAPPSDIQREYERVRGLADEDAAAANASDPQQQQRPAPQNTENQLVFIDGAVGTNGTSPFDGLKVYDPVPELMNSKDQGDRLFGYLMKSGFLWYVDTITEYFDHDKKTNFSFGVLADPNGAIDFLEHSPLFKHGKLGRLHKDELGETSNDRVFLRRSTVWAV